MSKLTLRRPYPYPPSSLNDNNSSSSNADFDWGVSGGSASSKSNSQSTCSILPSSAPQSLPLLSLSSSRLPVTVTVIGDNNALTTSTLTTTTTRTTMHSRNGSANSMNSSSSASAHSSGYSYSPVVVSALQPQSDHSHPDFDSTGKDKESKLSLSPMLMTTASGGGAPLLLLPGATAGTALPTPTTTAAFLSRQFARVTSGFSSLSDSPPELYKAYALKFLDSYAYFSFSLVFTLFLSDDFGLTDVQAGTVYGAWGALITVFGLFTGTIIDNLGVAKCLRIGFVLSFLTRCAIFYTDSKKVLLACLLGTLPFSNCLGIPVLTVGIRRYTNEVNRGFAFGLFYCVMNVGALAAGPLVDALTVYYNARKETGQDEVADDGDHADATGDGDASAYPAWSMTTNRAIILSGVFANFVAVFVAFSVREIKVDAKEEPPRSGNGRHHVGSIPCDDNDEYPAPARQQSKVSEFRPVRGSSWQILSETVREPNFRRFLLVCLLTINVRMVFRHLDGTLPKYMVREFGENTPKGKVYAINPALIIILVPIITAATTSVDPLLMIHRGTYVSALSVFFLAFSTSLPACVLFVITLSIGEAIWSPRLYDYTMSVAQEGREGTYMALSSAPLFLAKLPVGFLSGLLLQRYCPEHLEEGEVRHSKTMWWIIGMSTIISPIMITCLWGYISGGGGGVSSIHEQQQGAGDVGERRRRSSDGRGEISCDNEEGAGGVNAPEDILPYQHRPLTAGISLPRVRSDRPLV